MNDEKKPQSEYVFLLKYAFSTASENNKTSENKPTKMTETPETDELIRKYMTVIGTDAIGMASKLTLKCMDLERERNKARSRVNEIDLCQNGQSPCKWSLTLIAKRDAAIAEHDEAREQLSEWYTLKLWGGTPEIIHEFIKGQQDRIHHAQNVEKELAVAIAERDVLLQAIRNLRDTKGRYHTQQAFEYLMTLLPTNQND